MAGADRLTRFAYLPGRWQRGALALLLVLAQLLAAVHAVGHFSGQWTPRTASLSFFSTVTPAGGRDESPGAHAPCLLCVAAADLAAALPSASHEPPATSLAGIVPLSLSAVRMAARPACLPPCRGPPASV